jgi:hypothetical protein
MNLGINKEEAKFLRDLIHSHLNKSLVPDVLIDLYKTLGIDVPDILAQIAVIAEIGEEPITEQERNLFKK